MRRILVPCLVLLLNHSFAQTLKPGFDKKEYEALMHVSAQFGDSAYASTLPPPAGYHLDYRSAEVGLKNKWELWTSDLGIPVISIRGTTQEDISWLENFYAAMVPAKGEIQLSEGDLFKYKLAEDSRAAVHVGWLLGTAFLSKTILPKIDSLSKAGKKEILIVGHSQGGAIAFLLNALLYFLQKQGNIPPDIRFKTYCSAGPKPGNLYFAHEYEDFTQAGWAYNVINSADWVPQTPATIQTVGDFNTVSPFTGVKESFKRQGFFKRIALNYAYSQLTRPNEKAVRNSQKFLGKYVLKSVKKLLPGYIEPKYAASNEYVRAGNIITLLADEKYFQVFPQDGKNVFINHFHQPYLFLLEKINF